MRIAVLVSGGVDSSVALARLHEQGHELTAFYLKIWLEDELAYLGSCPWEDDVAYARAVCNQFNVPLHIVPLQQAYWDEVVSYTIASVKAGLTPNPDIFCNQRVKFGAFWRQYGHEFDAVATGHYARKEERDGVAYLCTAADQLKDQTYFLAHLSQEQLQKAVFPLGDMTKEEVRAFARQHGIATSERKDSQGICFLGKIKFKEFVKAHVGVQEGPLVDIDTGAVVGTHEGFWFFTSGQRQGIGLAGGPWYVVAKDRTTNTVYISRTYHTSQEYTRRNTFTTAPIHWLSGPDNLQGSVRVKLRHGPKSYPCTVVHTSDGGASVTLSDSDQGIAPGQFAVWYRDEYCLGCAMIQEAPITTRMS